MVLSQQHATLHQEIPSYIMYVHISHLFNPGKDMWRIVLHTTAVKNCLFLGSPLHICTQNCREVHAS
jgi:hypothetical protein